MIDFLVAYGAAFGILYTAMLIKFLMGKGGTINVYQSWAVAGFMALPLGIGLYCFRIYLTGG